VELADIAEAKNLSSRDVEKFNRDKEVTIFWRTFGAQRNVDCPGYIVQFSGI